MVDSLENDRLYYFQLAAVNVVGPGAYSDAVSATPTAPRAPARVSGLLATGEDGRVLLTWDIPSDGGSVLTSYALCQSEELSALSSAVPTLVPLSSITQNGATARYVVTNLENNRLYYFKVAAINAAGRGAYSEAASATPSFASATVPGRVSGLLATARDRQVILRWTIPSDGGSSLTSYLLRRDRDLTALSSATPTVIPLSRVTVDGVEASCVVDSLENDRLYYFQLAATNAVGTGAYSDAASATPTAPRAPSRVSGLLATGEDGRVRLTWDIPSDGGSALTSYALCQSETLSALSSAVPTIVPLSDITQNGSTARYVVPSLENGRQYYFKIAAINAAGRGAYSEAASATPSFASATVPGRVSGLLATARDRQVILRWTIPSDGGTPLTSYSLRRARDLSTLSSAPASVVSLSRVTENGIEASCVVDSLENGRLYYFQLAATNAVGTGAYSDAASATPSAPRVPSRVSSLLATGEDGRVLLTWDIPSDGGSALLSYALCQSETRSSLSSATPVAVPLSSVVQSGSTARYVVPNLENGRLYYFKVAATNVVGTGPYSSAASATPATPVVPLPPSQVTDLAATAGDGQVALRWSIPAPGGSPLTSYSLCRSERRSALSSATPVIVPLSSVTEDGATARHTVRGLTNGRQYYFKIAAVSVLGRGAYSEVVTATPMAAPVPGINFGTGSDSVRIYPNPTTGRLHVVLPAGSSYGAFLFSSDGQLVHQSQLSGGPQSIDLSHLRDGIYLLRLLGPRGEQHHHRVVKASP